MSRFCSSLASGQPFEAHPRCAAIRATAARIRQRGLRESDVAFVLAHGTSVPDGYMLTVHDAADLEREARHLMAMAQRLKGKLVVTSGAAVVTAYHARRARQKHALA